MRSPRKSPGQTGTGDTTNLDNVPANTLAKLWFVFKVLDELQNSEMKPRAEEFFFSYPKKKKWPKISRPTSAPLCPRTRRARPSPPLHHTKPSDLIRPTRKVDLLVF